MNGWTKLLLLCGLVSLSFALKDCIEPIRSSTKDDLQCRSEFALVPKAICHDNNNINEDIDDCTNRVTSQSQGSDVCAFVAESLFAEWRMLDAAFFTAGTCQASMAAGRFTAIEAIKILPNNNEVTGVRVKGKDILQALEDGLVNYYMHGNHDAYPHTAGLQYELDILQPEGQRIQNAKLLGFHCNWKPLQLDKSYMVLTNSAIANSVFSEVALESSGTGRGEAESLFLYATSVCTLKDNWHQMRLRHDPQKIPLSPPKNQEETTLSSTQRTVTATV